MHHHNHYYGQAHLLARYCGADEMYPPPIPGYLQHGWNIFDGWNPQHEFYPGAWRFVWSDAPRRRGYQLGRRQYRVIGSPWAYLLDMEPDLGVVPEDEREGTIFFLFHGWEGGKIAGEHARLVDEIKETEPGPITMSLYYTEYERPEVRQAYEDAGFRVVCFGKRGWLYEDTNRSFLYQQLREFRRHKRVASNRLCTAVFYGASVGCEPAVYGDPMELAGEDAAFGGVARIARLWPEMIGKEIALADVDATVRDELGLDARLSPEELNLLFGWDHYGKR